MAGEQQTGGTDGHRRGQTGTDGDERLPSARLQTGAGVSQGAAEGAAVTAAFAAASFSWPWGRLRPLSTETT